MDSIHPRNRGLESSACGSVAYVDKMNLFDMATFFPDIPHVNPYDAFRKRRLMYVIGIVVLSIIVSIVIWFIYRSVHSDDEREHEEEKDTSDDQTPGVTEPEDESDGEEKDLPPPTNEHNLRPVHTRFASKDVYVDVSGGMPNRPEGCDVINNCKVYNDDCSCRTKINDSAEHRTEVQESTPKKEEPEAKPSPVQDEIRAVTTNDRMAILRRITETRA